MKMIHVPTSLTLEVETVAARIKMSILEFARKVDDPVERVALRSFAAVATPETLLRFQNAMNHNCEGR